MRILGGHNVPERLLVVSAVAAQTYNLTYIGMYEGECAANLFLAVWRMW